LLHVSILNTHDKFSSIKSKDLSPLRSCFWEIYRNKCPINRNVSSPSNVNSRIVYFVQHKSSDRSCDREIWCERSERTCVELVIYIRSTAIERLSSNVTPSYRPSRSTRGSGRANVCLATAPPRVRIIERSFKSFNLRAQAEQLLPPACRDTDTCRSVFIATRADRQISPLSPCHITH